MREPNKGNENDIFESDIAFIAFGGSMLTGLGLVMLIVGLICSWSGWWFCSVELISFPYLRLIFQDGFFSINLPLGLLIIGIGLQLFTRFGWVVSQVILFAFLILFGISVGTMFPSFMAQGLSYENTEAVVLNSIFLLLVFGAIFYLFSPAVRKIYWGKQG